MDWQSVMDWLTKNFEAHKAMSDQYDVFWAQHVVFTWRWWLKLGMLILPWVFWLLIHRKDSTHRLLYAGVFVIAFSVILDEIGYNLGLWFYSAKLLSFIPSNTTYNLSVLPVATMLFIQFFPNVKPAYKALVFAAIGAFVSEPFLVWLGLYKNIHWAYWYSFPILFAMYMAASWLAHRDMFEKISGRS
jgi:hypothetical protein